MITAGNSLDTYAEGVVHLAEDVLLILDVIHVLALDDLVLLHRLNCVLDGRLTAEPADLDQTKGA